MKDALQEFASLAHKARHDAPPSIDVSHAVMHRLAIAQPHTVDRPLLWLTAGSAAMAAMMALFSWSLYATMADPLGVLFQVTPLLAQ